MKGYHRALYEFITLWVSSGPSAGSLLRLAQFTKEYKTTMIKELDVPPQFLEPPLLDGNEQNLIEDYFKLIVKKMDEWTSNLMKTEVDEFVQREQPPEVDVDGQYGMQGAVILFQMLNQQVSRYTELTVRSALARSRSLTLFVLLTLPTITLLTAAALPPRLSPPHPLSLPSLSRSSPTFCPRLLTSSTPIHHHPTPRPPSGRPRPRLEPRLDPRPRRRRSQPRDALRPIAMAPFARGRIQEAS